MVKKQIIDGFIISIKQLIPCAEVTASIAPFEDFNLPGIQQAEIIKDTGVICIDVHSILIWFVDILEQKVFFEIRRKNVEISSEEQRMIEIIPSLLKNLNHAHSKEFLGFSLKFSSRISFGDIIIAKSLQKVSSHALWSTIIVTSSYYGLSIKISQDGPVTFFEKGELLIQI